jgi:hypothetical protein
VIFGGAGNAGYDDLRGDTWEWDGTRWLDVTDATIGTRDHHAMAFDQARGVVVMYGGVSSSRRQPRETWVHPTTTAEWNGTRWTSIEGPNPGPRIGATMAFDRTSGRVLLFGGTGVSPNRLGDTWAWDGSAWTKISDAGPAPRTGHAMTFDRRIGAVVLWGGNAGGGRLLDDLWHWTGREWREIAQPDPKPTLRTGASLVYDTARNRLVLYGGNVRINGQVSSSPELWEWDGDRWQQR